MFDMTDHEKEYSEIWVCLLFLLVVSISFSWLMVPHWLALVMIFGVSLLKAALVAKYFMHFTKEAMLIIGSVATPFILLVIFIGLLWPDFGIHATDVSTIPGLEAAADASHAADHH